VGQLPAVVLGERDLVIEGVDVRRPAAHAAEDPPLCFRREVGGLGRHGIAGIAGRYPRGDVGEGEVFKASGERAERGPEDPARPFRPTWSGWQSRALKARTRWRLKVALVADRLKPDTGEWFTRSRTGPFSPPAAMPALLSSSVRH